MNHFDLKKKTTKQNTIISNVIIRPLLIGGPYRQSFPSRCHLYYHSH